jgi:protein phosphatase 1L
MNRNLDISYMQMASGPGSIAFGHHLIKGKSRHAMEDYFVAELRRVNDHELGLFAIYDGHLGHHVADYLQQNLFNNILNEVSYFLIHIYV